MNVHAQVQQAVSVGVDVSAPGLQECDALSVAQTPVALPVGA